VAVLISSVAEVGELQDLGITASTKYNFRKEIISIAPYKDL
jgi:hypothetical protein